MHVAATLPGAVHRHPGRADQVGCRRAIVRVGRHADARAHGDIVAAVRDRHDQCASQPLDHAQREAQVRLVHQHHHEFIARHARHSVAVAHGCLQSPRHDLEHGVTGVVAERMVDGLEAGQVDQHGGHQRLVTLRQVQGVVEPVPQQRAVGQSRQAVVVGIGLDLVGTLLAGGNVVADADEMRDLAIVVVHRRDLQVVPEHFAILAQVAQHDVDRAPLAQGDAHAAAFVFVQSGRGHEARIAADDFVGAVAGDVLERGVDVLDYAVGAGIAGDDHAIACDIECTPVQGQLALACALPGNVDAHADQVLAAVAVDARAAQQHRRFAAAARDVVGFQCDLGVVVEHGLDLHERPRAVTRVEHGNAIGGGDLVRHHLAQPLEIVVPQQDAAFAVHDVERARQQVDHRGQRRRAEPFAFGCAGQGRGDGDAVAKRGAVGGMLQHEAEAGRNVTGGRRQCGLALANTLEGGPVVTGQQADERLTDDIGCGATEQRRARRVPAGDAARLISQEADLLGRGKR